MSNNDLLKKFAEKIVKRFTDDDDTRRTIITEENAIVSDLTALISENYVDKAKYDEAVRQRDELKEALKQIMFSSGTLKTVQDIAEAAIKNTEG